MTQRLVTSWALRDGAKPQPSLPGLRFGFGNHYCCLPWSWQLIEVTGEWKPFTCCGSQLPSLPSPVLAGSSLERSKVSKKCGRCFVLIGGEERGREGNRWRRKVGGKTTKWNHLICLHPSIIHPSSKQGWFRLVYLGGMLCCWMENKLEVFTVSHRVRALKQAKKKSRKARKVPKFDPKLNSDLFCASLVSSQFSILFSCLWVQPEILF